MSCFEEVRKNIIKKIVFFRPGSGPLYEELKVMLRSNSWIIFSFVFFNTMPGLSQTHRCENLFISSEQIRKSVSNLAQLRREIFLLQPTEKTLRLKEFDELFAQFVQTVGDRKKAEAALIEAMGELSREKTPNNESQGEFIKKQTQKEADDLKEWQTFREIKKFHSADSIYTRKLVITPDSSQLISLAFTGEVKILDLQNFKRIPFPYEDFMADHVIFTADQSNVILVGNKSTKMFHLPDWQEVEIGDQPQGETRTAFLSPDEKKLVTAHGSEIHILDLKTRRPLSFPYKHEGLVVSAFFTPDQRYFVSIDSLGEIKVLNNKSKKEFRFPYRLRRYGVMETMMTPDSVLITLDADYRIRTFDFKTMQEILVPQPRLAPGPDYKMTISPDGSKLVIFGGQGLILIDLQTWEEIKNPDFNTGWLLQAVINSESTRLLTVGGNGLTRIFDLVTASLMPLPARQKVTRKNINAAAFSPDQSLFVTDSPNHGLKIYFRREDQSD